MLLSLHMEKLQWSTQRRKVNQLVPWEFNPRKMTETQVEHLKKSLEEFGLVEIPAIDFDNLIISGHQRLKVMIMLGRGEEEIDVRIPNRKLTPQEYKKYNTISNKISGDWDFELLGTLFEIDELKDLGFTDVELGFNIDKIEETKDEPKLITCPHCGQSFDAKEN